MSVADGVHASLTSSLHILGLRIQLTQPVKNVAVQFTHDSALDTGQWETERQSESCQVWELPCCANSGP